MRKLLGIFLATLSLTTPAAISTVTADDADEGAGERPPSATAQIGRVSVDLQLDRSRANPGDTVRATLVASAPREEKITLLVSLLDASSEPESRVGPPPERVESARVALVARPGGGPARTLDFDVPAGLDGGLGGRELPFMVVVERAGRGERSAWLEQQAAYSEAEEGGDESVAAAVSYVHVAGPARARLELVAVGPCAFDAVVRGDLPGALEAIPEGFPAQTREDIRGSKAVFHFAAEGCDAAKAREVWVTVSAFNGERLQDTVTLPAAPAAVASR